MKKICTKLRGERNKIVFLVAIILINCLTTIGQVLKPQPMVNPSWGPYLGAKYIPFPGGLASPYEVASFGERVNPSYQIGNQVTWIGRYGTVNRYRMYDSCGILKQPVVDSFVCQDGFSIDSNWIIHPNTVSPCGSPTNIHRQAQYLVRVINASYGWFYLMMDEDAIPQETRLYKRVGNTFTELFANLPLGVSVGDIRDFGDGINLELIGSFFASDFGQAGTWRDHVLYNPVTQQFTPWNQNNLLVPLPNWVNSQGYNVSNLTNDTLALIQSSPYSSFDGGYIHFAVKGVNADINNVVTGGPPMHIIDSTIIFPVKVIYISKNNIYIHWWDMFDYHISHFNGVSYIKDLVPSNQGAFFIEYNPYDGMVYLFGTAPGHFNTLSSTPAQIIPNTPLQDSLTVDLSWGAWRMPNGEYVRYSQWGLPGNVPYVIQRGYKVRQVDTAIITAPTQGQIFPAGTTSISLQTTDDFEGDTVFVRDNVTGQILGYDICDQYGNASINLTYSTPGLKTVNVYIKDPHGNIGCKVTRSFTIQSNPTNSTDNVLVEGLDFYTSRIVANIESDFTLLTVDGKVLQVVSKSKEYIYPYYLPKGVYVIKYSNRNTSGARKVMID